MKRIFFISSILSISLTLFACNKNDIKPDSYDLSVMSFNLRYDEFQDGDNRWDNRKEACIKLLMETEPSIIGIQEGLHHQVTYLDENLIDYAYVGVGRDDGYSSGEYAAIFYKTSRFDTLQYGNFWLSDTPEYPSLGWDANNIRIVTWVELKDKNSEKSIFIFNTHFDHKGKIAQEESAKLLLQRINDLVTDSAPIFITGDFNLLIRNEALNPITNSFFSAQRFASKSDNTNSFNGFGRWYISRNIDFIFYKNATAVAYKTIDNDYGVPFISDHYPIISYLNY